MKFLIVYGTSEGQTRKIARFIESTLVEKNHQVELCDASDNPPTPEGFDVVVLGSSIHMHKYHNAIVDYATRHKAVLNGKPTAFFTVCMALASSLEKEEQEVAEIEKQFIENTGWQPNHTDGFAGALKYTQYNYFTRLVMRMIAKKQGGSTDTKHDHEYTQWERVKEFAAKLTELA